MFLERQGQTEVLKQNFTGWDNKHNKNSNNRKRFWKFEEWQSIKIYEQGKKYWNWRKKVLGRKGAIKYRRRGNKIKSKEWLKINL